MKIIMESRDKDGKVIHGLTQEIDSSELLLANLTSVKPEPTIEEVEASIKRREETEGKEVSGFVLPFD